MAVGSTLLALLPYISIEDIMEEHFLYQSDAGFPVLIKKIDTISRMQYFRRMVSLSVISLASVIPNCLSETLYIKRKLSFFYY